MKILITGAAGGIGSILASKLQNQGHSLYLFDNLRNGYLRNLEILKVQLDNFHSTDVRNINSINFTQNIDVIIHLAAVTSLGECEANKLECISINVEGTLAMLEFARSVNCNKFIFASSSAVYENNQEAILSENLDVKPSLFYSMSKKMAEDTCLAFEKNYGLPVVICRFFNVFGPFQDIQRPNPPLINYIVREFLKKKSPILHSDGMQSRDYVHVLDVVNLLEKTLTVNSTGIFNVCSGQSITVREIVDIIKNCMDISLEPTYRSSKLLWENYSELYKGKYAINSNVISKETNKKALGSYEKAQDHFGWSPKKEIQKLIEDTVTQIIINQNF